MPASAVIDVRAEVPKFVSRAGIKLEKALDHFDIDVTGLVCLDSGLSTGGFTDCLLKRGAAQVCFLPDERSWSALIHCNDTENAILWLACIS